MQYARAVAREFAPERIVLFGSHARGKPGPDSDVDLLVIMSCAGKPVRQAIAIRHRLPASFPLDLIVRTPDQIKQRLAWDDFFLKEIMGKGEVLYEAARA